MGNNLRKCSAWKHRLIDLEAVWSCCHLSVLLFLPLSIQSNWNMDVQNSGIRMDNAELYSIHWFHPLTITGFCRQVQQWEKKAGTSCGDLNAWSLFTEK